MNQSTTITCPAPEMRARLRPLHQAPRPGPGPFISLVVHALLIAGCIAAWNIGWWPVSVLLWFAIAWVDHAALSRLHEAAHRMLVRSRLGNEVLGIMIGSFALTPLSVYRYVHTQHHTHLGREKDPEFWPYNLPGSPKWLRLLYAWLELTVGWIFTPMLYSLRTARAWPSLPRGLRQRLLMEWCVLAGFWAAILLIVGITKTWTWLLVGHLAPTWIAGTMQTIRKFTEHLGRFGDNILDMTRAVIYRGRFGRAASLSQLHVEHHGTHHRWPGIPWHKLPEATSMVYEEQVPGRVFPSHLAAIRDMLPHLADPRVGPQWKKAS